MCYSLQWHATAFTHITFASLKNKGTPIEFANAYQNHGALLVFFTLRSRSGCPNAFFAMPLQAIAHNLLS